LLAGLFVLRQRNFKRLLAYSSIEHMGVIAVGIGFGAPLAMVGALLHVLTHACAKGLAFLGSGSLLRGYQTKEIDEVRGAAGRMRLSGPMFLAAALALCGLPLSGVFRSEVEIVSGGMSSAQYVGVALLIVLVNLAFFGVLWHAGRMVLSDPAPPSDGALTAQPSERGVAMVLAMLGCLVVLVALGIRLPDELVALLHSAQLQLSGAR
jgi:hydrogenase-4 component F